MSSWFWLLLIVPVFSYLVVDGLRVTPRYRAHVSRVALVGVNLAVCLATFALCARWSYPWRYAAPRLLELVLAPAVLCALAAAGIFYNRRYRRGGP